MIYIADISSFATPTPTDILGKTKSEGHTIH